MEGKDIFDLIDKNEIVLDECWPICTEDNSIK